VLDLESCPDRRLRTCVDCRFTASACSWRKLARRLLAGLDRCTSVALVGLMSSTRALHLLAYVGRSRPSVAASHQALGLCGCLQTSVGRFPRLLSRVVCSLSLVACSDLVVSFSICMMPLVIIENLILDDALFVCSQIYTNPGCPYLLSARPWRMLADVLLVLPAIPVSRHVSVLVGGSLTPVAHWTLHHDLFKMQSCRFAFHSRVLAKHD
jgi:hypothetical protein